MKILQNHFMKRAGEISKIVVPLSVSVYLGLRTEPRSSTVGPFGADYLQRINEQAQAAKHIKKIPDATTSYSPKK